jgi:nucleotide-binding universal stress UspA family protein
MTTTVRIGGAEAAERQEGEATRPSHRYGCVAACVDGSPCAEGVLPHALALADALGSSVTLLHVLEDGVAAGVPTDAYEWTIRRREARSYLERLAAERAAEGTVVPTAMMEGSAAEEICDWAWDHGVDTTALCTHGSGGSPAWPLGATARKLVERAPSSLLLIPARTAAGRQPPRYRRIVVPLDGSRRAESVLPHATRVAAAHGAEMILVHVVPVPELTEIGPLTSEDQELRERVVKRNERVAAEYLDRLRARQAASGVQLRARVLRAGDVRNRLARWIEESGADLVVLHAHGRSERPDAPTGSVTAHLIRNTKTPLWILRPRPGAPLRRNEAAHREETRLPSQAAP